MQQIDVHPDLAGTTDRLDKRHRLGQRADLRERIEFQRNLQPMLACQIADGSEAIGTSRRIAVVDQHIDRARTKHGSALERRAKPLDLGAAGEREGIDEIEPQPERIEPRLQRLPAGQGDFDLRGFAAALPPGCPVSIELPREEALAAGVPPLERARQAIDGVRAAVA